VLSWRPNDKVISFMFLAKVYVAFKPTINDPEGHTVLGALKNLGFNTVSDVRTGKFIQLKIEAPEASTAQKQVEEMCEKLLSNPVIEDYWFELETV